MHRIYYWLNGVKAYLRDYVLENTGLKVLALMITAVMWLSVASRPVREVTLQEVPVRFPDLPNDLTITKYDARSARVTLRGPSDAVDPIRASDLSLVAEMTAVEPGVRVIQLKLDRSSLRGSAEEIGIEPRSIRVTVERVVEKEVPVKPRFEGDPAPGFEILGRMVAPATITIAGGASLLRDVGEVSTETVTLTNLTSSVSEQVAIDLGSPNITVSGEDRRKVQLTITIGEIQSERVIDRVPVSLINSPGAARPYPQYARLTVRGARSAVAGLSIADLSISADYSQMKAASRDAPLTASLLRFQDKISVKSIEPKSVSIR